MEEVKCSRHSGDDIEEEEEEEGTMVLILGLIRLWIAS